MKDKTILVTGGRGFIGSDLVNALKKDNEVRVFDIVEGNDIRDFNALKEKMSGVDYVFHFAALTSVTESVKNPIETIENNILGSFNVVRAATDNGVKKVVVASSAAVYGEPERIPTSEENPLKSVNAYGISKIFSELLLEKTKKESGLDYAALRYFNVYGPNQNPGYAGVIKSFIEQSLKNKDLVIFGDGSQTRDFIFIRDVTRANLLAAESSASGCFNIGSGSSISVLDLAKMIILLANSKSKIVFKEKRLGDSLHSCSDIERAKSMLNFKPEYTLEQGLKETIGWFRSNSH